MIGIRLKSVYSTKVYLFEIKVLFFLKISRYNKYYIDPYS